MAPAAGQSAGGPQDSTGPRCWPSTARPLGSDPSTRPGPGESSRGPVLTLPRTTW